MPGIRTEITEITTGLAMLGYQDITRALEVRPRHITHVDEAVFDRLEEAWTSERYRSDFEAAWSNGSVFARSPLGLRGRPPWTLEWKGHHRPASKSIETIPADLRVDHVYLISCKYGSQILHNAGPAALFDHCLASTGPVARSNWFETISPDAFREVWRPYFDDLGLPATTTPSTLTSGDRENLKAALTTDALDTESDVYREFVRDVSIRSADRWRRRVRSSSERAEMYWRLLRMQAAPYYVLGATRAAEPLRYRVGTPWDFAQRYTIAELDIAPGHRGQPSVDWTARMTDFEGRSHRVDGHVEVRWSHGKLTGSPEAKVYLDTPPPDVPGYDDLSTTDEIDPGTTAVFRIEPDEAG